MLVWQLINIQFMRQTAFQVYQKLYAHSTTTSLSLILSLKQD